jgi:ketosteroid isomerase-like protein
MKRLFVLVSIILGGLMMGSCQKYISTEISKKQIIEIESEIKSTAINHLNSKDAATALSYYTDDAILASNGYVYDSFEELTKMIEGYYDTLSTIDFADYYDMHIDVITTNTAFLTTKFRYRFTDTTGASTDLQGASSALYVRDANRWKMKFRHESLLPLK